MLCRLIDKLVDNYLMLLDQIEGGLEQVESDSFDARADDSILRRAASMQGELMEIRRLAGAQRSLLEPQARGKLDYISVNLGAEFRHIEDYLARTLDRVEAMRERLSGALNNYHSILTNRTNEIVHVLTMFAAVLLPMSLITGIDGMNVPVWPPGDRPVSLWGYYPCWLYLAAVYCGSLGQENGSE